MEREKILAIVYILSLATVSTAQCNQTTRLQYTEREILLTGTSGKLCSPGYPEYFAGSEQLTWQITAAESRTVHLEFQFFDVGNENSCDSEVDRSSVQVRDGEMSGALLGVFCGSVIPDGISSSGQKLWVRYRSSQFRSTKFKATFTTGKDSSSYVLLIAGLVPCFGILFCITATIFLLRRRGKRTRQEISACVLTNARTCRSAHGLRESTADSRSYRLHSLTHCVSFELCEMGTATGDSEMFQTMQTERGIKEESTLCFSRNDPNENLTPVG